MLPFAALLLLRPPAAEMLLRPTATELLAPLLLLGLLLLLLLLGTARRRGGARGRMFVSMLSFMAFTTTTVITYCSPVAWTSV